MSKKYKTKFFLTFSRLQHDFMRGKLSEEQFHTLLGLAISKEFSAMVNKNIQQLLPINDSSMARFVSYNWEKTHHVSKKS